MLTVLHMDIHIIDSIQIDVTNTILFIISITSPTSPPFLLKYEVKYPLHRRREPVEHFTHGFSCLFLVVAFDR